MNRGAKAISCGGGFTAIVHWQRMSRAPLFVLESNGHAELLAAFVKNKFSEIKEVAAKYSNHAQLISIHSEISGRNLHCVFTYTTGDASGQNMTTTCTWHAILWIADEFLKDTGIHAEHFVIEANGSSDKKVSGFLLGSGRGISVTAECRISAEFLKKILRTNAEDVMRFYIPAREISAKYGMPLFNINAANAVAAIFAATGQDLGSIHESSLAEFTVTPDNGDLHFSMHLPSLVVGTVGGGTGLPAQQEALKIMDCAGQGKIQRFAKLIAGFALSLEISTLAAIISGEFAKAHEKLGRKKPVNWLLKSELNSEFIRKCIHAGGENISEILISQASIENGILTNIVKRVNKKITGFIPLHVQYKNGTSRQVLLKSKALDLEVIKGLHLMAASIDPRLSDLIYKYRKNLEYWNCHLKELKMNKALSEAGFDSVPEFYGSYVQEEREIYFLLQERMQAEDLLLIDSENSLQKWTPQLIKSCISEISRIHIHFKDAEFPEVQRFEPWHSLLFYRKLAEIVCTENDYPFLMQLDNWIESLEGDFALLQIPIVIVHNDFNPRNVAIRKNKKPCIYDWELTVRNIPHRDIAEFLCFVLPEDFEESDFLSYLDFHYSVSAKALGVSSPETWRDAYVYALKEFLLTRAMYYKAAEVLFKLKFASRILFNAKRMIELLEK
jgi:hydroxymethylglutaryl-CoA reductase (NADPH)